LRPWRTAATNDAKEAGEAVLRKPTTWICDCCPRAVRGNATGQSVRNRQVNSLAILSGHRRSGAATLGWIVVARGLVLEDRRKAWVHTLAGRNDDMSRFGVMHPCGAGRSTEGDQKA
jgi:hypothetical protein